MSGRKAGRNARSAVLTAIILIAVGVVLALVAGCSAAGASASKPDARPKAAGPPRDEHAPVRSSCAPKGADGPWYIKSAGHVVFLPSGAEGPAAVGTRALIARAVKAHADAFREQEGASPLPATIVVTAESGFEKVGAPTAIGCYVHGEPTPTIYCWVGERCELPALYHEFAHRCFAQADVRHEHAGWKRWNERGDEIAERLKRMNGGGK